MIDSIRTFATIQKVETKMLIRKGDATTVVESISNLLKDHNMGGLSSGEVSIFLNSEFVGVWEDNTCYAIAFAILREAYKNGCTNKVKVVTEKKSSTVWEFVLNW